MAEYGLVPKVSQWGKKHFKEKTVMDEDGRPVRRKPIVKKDMTEQAVKENIFDSKLLQKHLNRLEIHKNRRLHQIDREVIEAERFLNRLSVEKESLRQRKMSASEFGNSFVLQQILKSLGLPTEVPTFGPPKSYQTRGLRSNGSAKQRSVSPGSVASQSRITPTPSLTNVSALKQQRQETVDQRNSSNTLQILKQIDLDSDSESNATHDIDDNASMSIQLDADDAHKDRKMLKRVTFSGIEAKSDSGESDNVTDIIDSTTKADDIDNNEEDLPWELRCLHWEMATRQQQKSPEHQSPAILKWKKMLNEEKTCPVPECTLHSKRYSHHRKHRISTKNTAWTYENSQKLPTLPSGRNSATSGATRRSVTPGTTVSSPSPNIFRDLDSEDGEDDLDIDWCKVDAISSVRRPLRGSNREKMMAYKEASLRSAFDVMRERVASERPPPFNKNYGEPTPNWKILNPLKLRHRIFHKSPLYVKWKM